VAKTASQLHNPRRLSSFPSHASEFGHAGDVLVDYVISDGDVVTF
jgi:hypothetical protein